MAFEIQAVDRPKLYVAIVDQIVDGVRSGAYPPGKALPSERWLASKLGVGRSSLREAIRVLEHAGVLDVRTGSGTYVSDEGLTKASMLRARAALVGEQSPLDIIVARRALEPACAELAAIHRRQADISHLRMNLRENALLLEDPSPESSQKIDEVDHSFHLAIAIASQNPVLFMVEEQIINVMRQGTWRDLKSQSRQREGRGETYLDQHRNILRAVEHYDAPDAAAAMAAHLDSIEAGLLAELP